MSSAVRITLRDAGRGVLDEPTALHGPKGKRTSHISQRFAALLDRKSVV